MDLIKENFEKFALEIEKKYGVLVTKIEFSDPSGDEFVSVQKWISASTFSQEKYMPGNADISNKLETNDVYKRLEDVVYRLENMLEENKA